MEMIYEKMSGRWRKCMTGSQTTGTMATEGQERFFKKNGGFPWN
ncbi:MAG: hypothetical protein ACLSE4_00540 [Clostridium sp.]